MQREEIIDRLRTTKQQSTQEAVDWDSVTLETDIGTLGFDSLSILDLIYDVQQEFDLEFEAEELIGVRTVGELVGFLEGQLAG